MDIRNKRVLVTGGSGFLGGHVLARLRKVGCRHVIAPRSSEYDLAREPDVLRLLQKERPEVVWDPEDERWLNQWDGHMPVLMTTAGCPLLGR